MIWGTIRRKVSSSQVLGQAWKVRSAASAQNCYSTAPKKALFNGRGFECIQRSSYHIASGSYASKSSRVATSLMQTESFFRFQNRSFSSDGDLVEAVVPFMGESITDGTLATFLKKPGDKVAIDEPIAQIETDKVTIDVVSPEAGVIQKFVAKEGETVEPGVKIAIISKSGEGVEQAAPSEKASSQSNLQKKRKVPKKKFPKQNLLLSRRYHPKVEHLPRNHLLNIWLQNRYCLPKTGKEGFL